MICPKCGTSMKFRGSYSTGKHEVWTCPRKTCKYREEFKLWGKAKDRAA